MGIGKYSNFGVQIFIIMLHATHQKSNAYLKQIADVCGIKKNLLFTDVAHGFHLFSNTATALTGEPVPPRILRGNPIKRNLPLPIRLKRFIIFS